MSRVSKRRIDYSPWPEYGSLNFSLHGRRCEEWTAAEVDRHDAVMAKTVITHIADDLDGSKDAQEVTFALNGAEYLIDLGKKNLAAFEKALKPYIDAATPMSSRTRSSSRRSSTKKTTTDLGAVRAWATENGIAVSERGRVAKSVLEQYQAAHQ